jgi:hypothetical protein
MRRGHGIIHFEASIGILIYFFNLPLFNGYPEVLNIFLLPLFMILTEIDLMPPIFLYRLICSRRKPHALDALLRPLEIQAAGHRLLDRRGRWLHWFLLQFDFQTPDLLL